MTNSLGHNTKLQELSILVRLDGFSFYTRDSEGAVVASDHVAFTTPLNPQDLVGSLESAFAKAEFPLHHYKKVQVVYSNNLFTLVPKALFDENILADYLKFNAKILATDFVTYDEISHHDLMNVYIPYANANNYFFDRYGSFDFYHSISLLAEEALKQPSEVPLLLVHVNPASFEVVVTHKKKLLLANCYSYTTKEDFIYYLLFTVEQLDLNAETLVLQFAGMISEEHPCFEMAYMYIRNVAVIDEAPHYLLNLLA